MRYVWVGEMMGMRLRVMIGLKCFIRDGLRFVNKYLVLILGLGDGDGDGDGHIMGWSRYRYGIHEAEELFIRA